MSDTRYDDTPVRPVPPTPSPTPDAVAQPAAKPAMPSVPFVGGDTAKQRDLAADNQEAGSALTTNQGLKVSDDQNSLRAGARGPTLMEDFHLREKITHFDHERIPERVVHARGAAAHGIFQVYEPLTDLTTAAPFQDPAKETPVFVRFSTVAGSRGSADTVRDVRGFAVKFYTEEGVWDLVGNNMPVFFIQDAVKFPDLIHAVKPEPHNEIPQAQSAHDTFWDFVSLTPESAHMLMWVMSDRAIPRSYATMEGFGVHTFRLVNAAGKARFVKFHWKPLKGVFSQVWDEAQKTAGKDPDFHRRDLFDAIERGDFPQWELGLQVIEEEDEFKYGVDILDPTKIIPEEEVPVRRVGLMTLTANPGNFFAETEQVAFHVGHVVPGIDFTNDPLLQGRLFSYLDTQLRRVGPNFAELPINRPLQRVDNNQRDGMGRRQINRGRVAYFPNGLAHGCPMHSPEAADAFRSYAEKVDGAKIRVRSDSFGDHFSQATLFWNSMTGWEKDHIVAAFSFELNQCTDMVVRQRVMDVILSNIALELAQGVAARTGIPLPEARTHSAVAGQTGADLPNAGLRVGRSPALSMDRLAEDIRGRKVAVLVDKGVSAEQLTIIQETLMDEEAIVEVVAPTAGTVQGADGVLVPVTRAAPNAPSVVYDAVIVPGGVDTSALQASGLFRHFLNEAFLHGKPIAAIGTGEQVLAAANLPTVLKEEGVIIGETLEDTLTLFVEAMRRHRFPQRNVAPVPA
ncbi:catalase [Nitrospirillum amazonense]|uniref:Catalase n=1 Tax=Nitrospirillum amazonense TaxID=28077 RepID=A0A560JBG5_9PROT|nr:catalase [Nitrospirillum amazonense]TWB67839.1 catalase [Nitrospirillum amazonense]